MEGHTIMAYRDYICCRDCKSKFIYDGNDSIRNSLEATYGDENAPNWTVKLVCPNCLARLERKPLTEDEIELAYREIWRDLSDGFSHTSAEWIEAGIRYAEKVHGIEQARNTRRNDLHTIGGVTRCLAEWCEILDEPWTTVKKRVAAGRDPFVRMRPDRRLYEK
jgi:hypothetical protein